MFNIAELALYLETHFRPILPHETILIRTSQAATPQAPETIVTPTGKTVVYRPTQLGIPNIVNMTASVEQTSGFIGRTDSMTNTFGVMTVGLVPGEGDDDAHEVAVAFTPNGATQPRLPHYLSRTVGIDEVDPRIVYASDYTLAVVAISQDNLDSIGHLRLMTGTTDPTGVETKSSRPIPNTNEAVRMLGINYVHDPFSHDPTKMTQQIKFETASGDIFYVNIDYDKDTHAVVASPVYYFLCQTRARFPTILYNSW